MINLFKSKKYPVFYQNYLDSFKNVKQNLNEVRFVVFDTETTSLVVKNNSILSIGCIAVVNFKINVNDQLECYILQKDFDTETVKIHGLLKKGILDKVDEFKGLQLFLNYIQNAVLVAHHAAFDIAMINKLLVKNGLPKLKNKVIDTSYLHKKTKYVKEKEHFSLDELCREYQIVMHDRHTASGDAYLTALLFLKISKILIKRKKNLKLNHLTQWIQF